MKFDHTKIKFGGHVQEHVRTQSGASVVLLGETRVSSREVLVGMVNPPDESLYLIVWELDGSCISNSNLSLVMTGTKRKLSGWLNIYPDGHVSGTFYDSKGDAIRFGIPNAVARIYHEIEYEEGEGL